MRSPDSIRLALALAGLVVLWTPASWNGLWGLNLWALWPPIVRVVLTLVVLAGTLVPPPEPKHGPRGGRAAAAPSPARNWLLAAAASALVLLWILAPARTLLFGDAGELAGRFAPGMVVAPRSPLFSGMLDLVRRLFDIRSAPVMLDVMRALSTACGILALGLVALQFRRRRLAVRAGTAALFLGGGLGLFQGYVETYALLALGFLGYALAVGEPAGGRRSALLLALQILLVGAHTVGLVLLPLTFWLVMAALPAPRRGPLAAAIVVALVVGAVAARTTGILIHLPALDLAVISRFLAARVQGYQAGHSPLRDLLDSGNNLLLAAAPAFLGLGLLSAHAGGRRALRRVGRSPLGVLGAGLLLVRSVLATSLGAFLDWDFGAAFVLPFQLAVATAWSAPEVDALRRRAARALPVVALVLAVPQWLVLRDSDRATARATAYRDGRPAPSAAIRAQVDHRLGDELARAGDESAAALAFDRAFAADPRGLYARRAGVAWGRAGQRGQALDAFNRAVGVDPSDVVALEQRAFLRRDLGDLRSAADDFAAVLRVQPDRPNALMGLGAALVTAGDTVAARPLLFRAAALYQADIENGRGHAQTPRLLEQCLELAGRSSGRDTRGR